MKAVVYRRFGGPEVLEYTDVPNPKLAQNSVLVRVRAAALNPADHQLQAGLGVSHTDAWFPVIPGWDVAGVVKRVGAGVSEFAPGDEVIGYIHQDILHNGAYAELVSAPVETLVRKPRTASWPEAAGLPLAGLTAYRAIVQTLNVEPGETVLIHGAAGGVGVLAAQLALARASRVIGAASMGHHDFSGPSACFRSLMEKGLPIASGLSPPTGSTACWIASARVSCTPPPTWDRAACARVRSRTSGRASPPSSRV